MFRTIFTTLRALLKSGLCATQLCIGSDSSSYTFWNAQFGRPSICWRVPWSGGPSPSYSASCSCLFVSLQMHVCMHVWCFKNLPFLLTTIQLHFQIHKIKSHHLIQLQLHRNLWIDPGHLLRQVDRCLDDLHHGCSFLRGKHVLWIRHSLNMSKKCMRGQNIYENML